MPLNDVQIRAAKAKPGLKVTKLSDGGGLYLEIAATGSKLWRLKYRYQGVEKRLALGRYPLVSLLDARRLRDEAKRLLSTGIDPADAKRREKQQAQSLAADNFESIAREWIARHLAGRSESHYIRVVRRLEREALPYLGRRPVTSITAVDILEIARRIENRGVLDTAHRTMQSIGAVLRYAVQTGRLERDPTLALRGALPSYKSGHFAAPATDPHAIGGYLRMIDSFTGSLVVSIAIRLLPYLFCRPGELRTMRWEQIDFDAAEWRYTTSKTGTEMITPLSTQAVALLREAHALTGRMPGGFVFVGGHDPKRAMSEAAMGAAYKRLGIDTGRELTPHGWRAVARTQLHERLGFDPAIIEHQLGHDVPDSLGRSYNRTRFLKQRGEMMQRWADYLDALKAGSAPP